MRLVRPVLVAALIALLGGCAAQQNPQGPGQVPQTVTLRNPQTGATRTVSGAMAMLALAQRELIRRNYGAAARLATEAINARQLAGAELAEAHSLRGDAYFFAGEAAKARDDWRAALEIDGQNTMALRGMALISQMQRKMPEAIRYMDRAIATQPNNASLYVLRGLLRMDVRPNYALAMADFDRAIAMKPDLATAYYFRGLVHHLNGRLALAKAQYEKALEVNPGERRARQMLGVLERQARAGARPRVPRGPQVLEF
jgi:tetratricopeptide (TPR) repeat protein